MTTVQPSACALADAAAAIFLASASESVLRMSMVTPFVPSVVVPARGPYTGDGGVKDEFSVAIGLLATLEDQFAGGREGDAASQARVTSVDS